MDKFKEECGVFGVTCVENAAYVAYQGTYALQHRGQESAGISTFSQGIMYSHKNMGLVSQVFKGFNFDLLPGTLAIAHNRYSTTGTSNISNAQPLCMETKQGMMSIAHNGNIVNAAILREMLQQKGAIFQTSSDSEVIVHLLSMSKHMDFNKALKDALTKLKGAFSIVALHHNKLIAARDPYGFRPFVLGKMPNGGFCVASETCAFDLIGAEYLRDIAPGEIITISGKKLHSEHLPKAPHFAKCIFEYVYFSRPDSIIFGENCDKVRREMGRQLAREDDIEDADIVISVPDSSNTAALGYAEESKYKFEIGLIRNHYVGRTFIKPKQQDRELSVRLKFNPVKGVIRGKKIILIEDSIVRGTTLKGLIKFMRQYGAREIHVRVASPVVKNSCFFGIDLSTRKELIGAKKTIKQIAKHIGADSLKYLSLKGMLDIAPGSHKNYCTGCFGGKYPIAPPVKYSKNRLTNKLNIASTPIS